MENQMCHLLVQIEDLDLASWKTLFLAVTVERAKFTAIKCPLELKLLAQNNENHFKGLFSNLCRRQKDNFSVLLFHTPWPFYEIRWDEVGGRPENVHPLKVFPGTFVIAMSYDSFWLNWHFVDLYSLGFVHLPAWKDNFYPEWVLRNVMIVVYDSLHWSSHVQIIEKYTEQNI